MDHVRPTGHASHDGRRHGPSQREAPVDAMTLLGDVRPHADRPYVVLKYAQTLDGRIATATGDSKWISGEPERIVSHALRAACAAVIVGIGTVVADDPELTVRMVAGASPMRVVLDSGLRVPLTAKILDPTAATTVFTTDGSDPQRRALLRERGVRVEVTDELDGRVSLRSALTTLRATGTESLLVEGGSELITALLASSLVDRVIVGIAPIVIGAGTEAVKGLGVGTISAGIHLTNRTLFPVGDDIVAAWDVASGSRSRVDDAGTRLQPRHDAAPRLA
jgi:riboflavin-specific deaminase-like protein